MPEPLNSNERRVLGVLIEKHLSQPTYYPMTLNAIVAGCNQKSNRDPVVSLREDQTHDALESLKARGLVSVEMPGLGSRVSKFKELTLARFGWEKRERAIMAELLLRGPQTPGELRTRGGRMTAFPDLAAVEETLQRLAGGDDPFIRILPKAPGQSAARCRHCFYAADEAEALQTSPVSYPPDRPVPGAAGVEAGELEDLRAEIRELRERVEELTHRVADLGRSPAD